MFSRWGLQRRIMAYVAVGVALVFAAFYYVGQRTVDQGTDLVFQERLAIAQSVANSLADEIHHMLPDAEERVSHLPPDADDASVRKAIDGLYAHFTAVDDFTFFTVESVLLVDGSGRIIAAVPGDTPVEGDTFGIASDRRSEEGPWIEWPGGGDNWLFSAVLSAGAGSGDASRWVKVRARGRTSPQQFLAFQTVGQASYTATASPISQYHLEVMDRSGAVVAYFGPDEVVGVISPHYEVAKDVIVSGGSQTYLHTAPGVNEGRPHIMAVAPVPSTPLYLVTEQDVDVALALPARFRRDLLLFAVFGFLATMGVAWVTTSRVVRPTRQLTAAAARMADGDLDDVIEVSAEDEIGVLAENLERMRQQLRSALREIESANRDLERRVQERTQQLQQLVHRVLTAQEDERHRVSLELHDETAQALTVLVMTLESVQREESTLPAERRSDLRDARALASSALEGVRRMINALGPAALERRGVAAALRSYGDEFLGRAGVNVEVRREGERVSLPRDVEIALFRIGQEAINNIARHARATSARATLRFEHGSAVLTVEDDGVGFATESLAEPRTRRSAGIAGMRERARVVGGEVVIDSAPGRGTVVRATVPVPSDV